MAEAPDANQIGLGDFAVFSDEVIVYILQFLEPKNICSIAVFL
jgi:hypothetical protein